MAIYRFRVSFEDYDEILREIEIISSQTFLDLHQAIHEAVGYNPECPSSFYVSNDHWKKGEEIAYLPSELKKEKGVNLMETARLNKFIDDPHQKFYYIYNFGRPYEFHVKLIKILKEEEGKKYPFLFKSVGKAPKPFNNTDLLDDPNLDTPTEEVKNEFDFLNDMAYDGEEEDIDLLDEEGLETDEFQDQAGSEDDI